MREVCIPGLVLDFDDFIRSFSQHLISLKGYIKQSKQCFIRYPHTSKLVKKKKKHFSQFPLSKIGNQDTGFAVILFDRPF